MTGYSLHLVGFSLFARRPSPPSLQGESRDEVVWKSGADGEERVERQFASSLDDSWTLLRGYKNNMGEIDQILVGPQGVFAIEIKNINGEIECNGDQWSLDKFDKYGNLVESGKPIFEKGNRSPSQQVNQATDELESFLNKSSRVGHIVRSVLFVHERARKGDIRNATVDYVGFPDWSPDALLKLSSTSLDESTIAKVLKTIQNDHIHFARQNRRPDGRQHRVPQS